MSDDNLLTPSDLAKHFGVPVAKIMEWQRDLSWPRVKVGRTIRWTRAQLAEIEAKHTVTAAGVESAATDGRTALSQKRSA